MKQSAIAVILCFVLCSLAQATDTGGYSRNVKWVIQEEGITGSSTLSNFPAMLNVTSNVFKYTNNGGYVCKTQGWDIIVTDKDGNQLAHEVEKYVYSTGQLIAWVRIPVLSATVDTTNYIYFGNASVTAATENKTNVWDSGYVAVWHMKETAALDSTANGNNCTAGSAVTVASGGKIGSALSFDDTVNSYCTSAANLTSLSKITNAVTMEGWANIASGQTQYGWIMGRQEGTGSGDNLLLGFLGLTPDVYVDISGTDRNLSPGTSYGSGTWIHFAATWQSGDYLKFYSNAVEKASSASTYSGSIPNPNNSIDLGNNDNGVNNFSEPFEGQLDELRLSKVKRSADWLKACWMNVASNSVFSAFGGEVAQSGSGVFIQF